MRLNKRSLLIIFTFVINSHNIKHRFTVQLTQTGLTFTNAKTYKVTYTVTVSAGNIDARLQGSGATVTGTSRTFSGTYTDYLVSTGNTSFRIRGNDAFIGTVDNVSVKEVDRDNVPRIDYTGGGCPHILAEPQRTNIVFPSDVAVTQTRTVTAVEYALSFYGTGSIVLSGTHSATLTGTGVNDRVDLIFTPTAGSLVLTVSGTVTNFQLEVGSYATSYIPTSGSTVTRNQDIFTRDGIGSLINSTEGVLFVEMAALSDDLTNRRITISDGVGGNDVGFRFNNSSNTIQVVSYINYSVVVNESYVLSDITDIKKYALKWALNNYALWVDGVEVITDISAISFPVGTLNTLNFGSATGSSPFYGKVKQLQVYTTALTDEQLLQLTGESGTDFYESYAEMATALTYTIQ